MAAAPKACGVIGLGIMGLADLMYHAGVRYGSLEGQEFASQVMEFVRYHSMKTSIEMARVRGAFPAISGSVYDPNNLRWNPPTSLVEYDSNWNRPSLDWASMKAEIRQYGIRNAAQTTVAPTGTIATVAGCEGYGCEPVFALAYIRHVNDNGKVLTVVTSLLGAFTPFYAAYAGTKAPVEHFTRAAAKEFGKIDFLLHAIAFASMEDLKRDTIETSRSGFLMAMEISAYSLIAVCNAARTVLAEIDLIEIGLEDLLLAVVKLEQHRHKQLGDLALQRALSRQKEVLDELLRDGAAAGEVGTAAPQVPEERADDGQQDGNPVAVLYIQVPGDENVNGRGQ